ncbi:MAG: cytochrome b/b6 domain-containing protein [Stellaceae bacterium]
MSGNRKVLIWDFATRLFHWLLVGLVAAAYATWRLNWMEWHAWIGEAVLALILFRLLWGFFGSDSARFAWFLASPRKAARYLSTMLRREPDRQVGHNPAGGWMVLLFIGLLLGETLTGLYVLNDVADEGPFTEITPAPIANAITALHAVLWDALLAAVALHLAAILLYAVVKRQNLVWPLITGRKTLPDVVSAPRIAGGLGALLLLVLSAIAAAALARYL